jgi:hypothetical protein
VTARQHINPRLQDILKMEKQSSNGSIIFKDARLKNSSVGHYVGSLHLHRKKGIINPHFPIAR